MPDRGQERQTSVAELTARGEWPRSHFDLPILLTDQDLAHLRNVSVRTLQRERRQGRSVRFKKVGRQIYYARDDVLAHYGIFDTGWSNFQRK